MKRYYIFYRTYNSHLNFVYSIRDCKRPRQTKEYKKIQAMMVQDIVKSSGWCTEDYYNENIYEFVNTLNYIKL